MMIFYAEISKKPYYPFRQKIIVLFFSKKHKRKFNVMNNNDFSEFFFTTYLMYGYFTPVIKYLNRSVK